MTVSVQGPKSGDAATCERILRTVPEWFGIESAIQHYLRAVPSLPTFTAQDAETTIGFLSVKQPYPKAAEIYLIAVARKWHRHRVGTKLLERVEQWLREQGVTLLQVKTLGEAQESSEYVATRQFYEYCGFQRLEEFPNLWPDGIPCLLMVKAL